MHMMNVSKTVVMILREFLERQMLKAYERTDYIGITRASNHCFTFTILMTVKQHIMTLIMAQELCVLADPLMLLLTC